MRLQIAELTKVPTTNLFVDVQFVQLIKVVTEENETEKINNVLGKSTEKQNTNKNEKQKST